MLTNKNGLQARRLVVFHENTLLADWRFTPTTSVIGHLEESTVTVARLVREMCAAGGLQPPPRPQLLAETCIPSKYAAPPADVGHDGFCHPGVFLAAVAEALPEDAVVCVDVG